MNDSLGLGLIDGVNAKGEVVYEFWQGMTPIILTSVHGRGNRVEGWLRDGDSLNGLRSRPVSAACARNDGPGDAGADPLLQGLTTGLRDLGYDPSVYYSRMLRTSIDLNRSWPCNRDGYARPAADNLADIRRWYYVPFHSALAQGVLDAVLDTSRAAGALAYDRVWMFDLHTHTVHGMATPPEVGVDLITQRGSSAAGALVYPTGGGTDLYSAIAARGVPMENASVPAAPGGELRAASAAWILSRFGRSRPDGVQAVGLEVDGAAAYFSGSGDNDTTVSEWKAIGAVLAVGIANFLVARGIVKQARPSLAQQVLLL